jgi:hypothetical protein
MQFGDRWVVYDRFPPIAVIALRARAKPKHHRDRAKLCRPPDQIPPRHFAADLN